MRLYEMLTIFPPYLSEEDLTGAMEQVNRYVTTAGGEITQAIKDSPWGRRRLAYTIRHNGQDLRDGFYVLYYFNLESRRVAEVERAITRIRYLHSVRTVAADHVAVRHGDAADDVPRCSLA